MFLSALCVLSLNSSEIVPQTDTLERYIIDGQQVERFDGSQLIGKTVTDYRIGLATKRSGGTVFRMHLISTTERKGTNTVSIKGDESRNAAPTSGNAIYLIDGKVGGKEIFNALKPDDIASITIYKAGSAEAEKLSGKKDASVFDIKTKKK